MNNKLIALAVAASVTAGLAAPLTASAAVEHKWFGYSQLTLEKHDQAAATSSKPAQDGIRFGADRVRIGYKIKDGKVFGKLQVDFNKPSPTKDSGTKHADQDQGGFNEIIKDAEGGYKFSNAASLKIGQFKTPVGMDFNTSGKKLDITKRGMEKKLVLERSQGIMLSGRKMNGFGYDLFYGNAAARSSAVVGSTNALGAETATAARIMYDMGKTLHLELSTGTSTNANSDFATNPTAVDYSVTDFGARYKAGPFVGKFEYITGTDVRGVSGWDEKVWFLHAGYKLNKTTELVARYYDAKADNGTGNNAKLTNLYLGATLWLGSSKTNGRLQLNYVIAGGDTGARKDATSGPISAYNGAVTKGYTDDAIIVQYQVSF